MTGTQAEVGDIVEDGEGRQAIVTDIRQNVTWILRPRWGPTTAQWETTRPGSLRIVETRASHLSSERGSW
ncbi:hypothetical protein [Streptomyces sp. NBC_01363]|uniref:hypothetical protein n=1 Tax=Streptomyces sp. NBC_01363 TaxID=2903840 RepID=UPI002259AB0D|nr:hypothetical protein [Streptomyces sp. NBC_01363]MCX4734962.1 hypothetical protein [Streptomyces sp. NBC_01363]